MRYRVMTILILLLPWLVSTSLAGDWRVIPIKMFLGPKAKSGSVRLINNDSAPLNLQVTAKTWHQDETGQDIYEETEDIVFFPRVMTVPPGKEQVLRAGIKRFTSSAIPTPAASAGVKEFSIAIISSSPKLVLSGVVYALTLPAAATIANGPDTIGVNLAYTDNGTGTGTGVATTIDIDGTIPFANYSGVPAGLYTGNVTLGVNP